MGCYSAVCVRVRSPARTAELRVAVSLAHLRVTRLSVGPVADQLATGTLLRLHKGVNTQPPTSQQTERAAAVRAPISSPCLRACAGKKKYLLLIYNLWLCLVNDGRWLKLDRGCRVDHLGRLIHGLRRVDWLHGSLLIDRLRRLLIHRLKSSKQNKAKQLSGTACTPDSNSVRILLHLPPAQHASKLTCWGGAYWGCCGNCWGGYCC